MLRRFLPAVIVCAAVLGPARAGDAPERRTVDLAICLDTSGSMNGLIDSARQRIWAIVNDLATAKPAPKLRVALVAYGGKSYGAETGFVAVQTPFTDDLDLVSKKLFALEASGSVEYVGRAIGTALEFDWQKDSKALQLIVIAGNESADQDKEHPFRDMCKRAIERNVMIDSFFCGNGADAEAQGWREIARLADGHYAAIDQNRAVVDIATPFDERLAALSGKLNETYVPFGAEGRAGWTNQRAQDSNATGASGAAAAERASAKSTTVYYCRWCLVDATREGNVELEKVKDEDLPEAMRGMSLEEKRAYLDARAKERAALQETIARVHEERRAWLAEHTKDREDTFDDAVRKALRAQAEAKGYKFE
jgi:hypothetical protein